MHSELDRTLATLARARHAEEVEAILSLSTLPEDRLREGVVERIAWLAEHNKADSGAHVRTALVRALEHLGRAADVPLLERMANTHEFLGTSDVAGLLRATALVGLRRLDPGLAAFHAVRLLAEPAVSMSGDPLLTAVRVLADLREAAPLYRYLLGPEPYLADAVGEALRGMTGTPASVVLSLFEVYRDDVDDTVLVGLIDLLLRHEDRAALRPATVGLLVATPSIDLYRFAVTEMVALRRVDLAEAMAAHPDRGGKAKSAILEESLSLLPATRVNRDA